MERTRRVVCSIRQHLSCLCFFAFAFDYLGNGNSNSELKVRIKCSWILLIIKPIFFPLSRWVFSVKFKKIYILKITQAQMRVLKRIVLSGWTEMISQSIIQNWQDWQGSNRKSQVNVPQDAIFKFWPALHIECNGTLFNLCIFITARKYKPHCVIVDKGNLISLQGGVLFSHLPDNPSTKTHVQFSPVSQMVDQILVLAVTQDWTRVPSCT